MSETTARIRWEEDGAGGFEGRIGTLKPHVFTLWQSPCDGGDYVIGDWVLVSSVPIPADCRIGYTHSTSGKDADALKAQAERWLEEFVTSLGAVFPEPLGDSRRFQVNEARDVLDLWGKRVAGGPDVYGAERTLADQVRALLAIVDQSAPGTEEG